MASRTSTILDRCSLADRISTSSTNPAHHPSSQIHPVGIQEATCFGVLLYDAAIMIGYKDKYKILKIKIIYIFNKIVYLHNMGNNITIKGNLVFNRKDYKSLSKRDKRELCKWFGGEKKRKIKKRVSRWDKLLKELPDSSYESFLRSRYWEEVRKMVLRRDKYCCIICGSKENLQIHHDSYKNHRKEHKHLEDLMTLCRNCHEEHHYAQP